MKPFTTNPDIPKVTRDGRKARVICWDRRHDFPIIALIGDESEVRAYSEIGRFLSVGESGLDLFDADPPRDCWVNVYESYVGVSYETRQQAEDVACYDKRTHVLHIIIENGEPRAEFIKVEK